MGKLSNKIVFETIGAYECIWKTPKSIISAKNPLSTCPKCYGQLSAGFSLIPLTDNEKAKISGMECRKCGVLFVADPIPVRRILKDNLFAKDITLNGKYFWNYSIEKEKANQYKKMLDNKNAKLKILGQVDSGIILVTLENDNEEIDYVITRNRNTANNFSVLTIHYSDYFAREILTGLYRSERNGEIKLNGRKYNVKQAFYPSVKNKMFPEFLMPSEVKIKKGGGCYSSINNNRSEIVDLLLYSPYTKRYELSRATYDKDSKQCYMDIGIFRSFLNEYGNPGLHLSFGNTYTSGLDFRDMRTESMLHVYGYTVLEAEGLTDAERQSLLAEIVDLGLLTIPYIVNLLNLFCRTHNSDKYINARYKWQRDMKYIANYKVNPNRFLIMR